MRELLLSEKPDAAGECSAIGVDESWDGMCGVEYPICQLRVGVVGDVVETTPQSPIALEQMEPFFELQIDSVVCGEPIG